MPVVKLIKDFDIMGESFKAGSLYECGDIRADYLCDQEKIAERTKYDNLTEASKGSKSRASRKKTAN